MEPATTTLLAVIIPNTKISLRQLRRMQTKLVYHFNMSRFELSVQLLPRSICRNVQVEYVLEEYY